MSNPLLEKFNELYEPETGIMKGRYTSRKNAQWYRDHPKYYPNKGEPLYQEYMDAILSEFGPREALVKKYAWAVPSEEALDMIAKYSPNGVIEIGAGTGYWADQISKRGVKVYAYDLKPARNHYVRGCYAAIGRGGPGSAQRHSSGTLLLCWPPHTDSMAVRALDHFRGDTLIYVGEGCGGCTGDDEFCKRIGEHWYHTWNEDEEDVFVPSDWAEIDSCSIPTFPGMHDYLRVYKRVPRVQCQDKPKKHVPRLCMFCEGPLSSNAVCPKCG